MGSSVSHIGRHTVHVQKCQQVQKDKQLHHGSGTCRMAHEKEERVQVSNH